MLNLIQTRTIACSSRVQKIVKALHHKIFLEKDIHKEVENLNYGE